MIHIFKFFSSLCTPSIQKLPFLISHTCVFYGVEYLTSFRFLSKPQRIVRFIFFYNVRTLILTNLKRVEYEPLQQKKNLHPASGLILIHIFAFHYCETMLPARAPTRKFFLIMCALFTKNSCILGAPKNSARITFRGKFAIISRPSSISRRGEHE